MSCEGRRTSSRVAGAHTTQSTESTKAVLALAAGWAYAASCFIAMGAIGFDGDFDHLAACRGSRGTT